MNLSAAGTDPRLPGHDRGGWRELPTPGEGQIGGLTRAGSNHVLASGRLGGPLAMVGAIVMPGLVELDGATIGSLSAKLRKASRGE